MPITEYPGVLQKNSSAYINAGITYYGSLQSNITGTVALVAPMANVIGSLTSGSGYAKYVLSGNATLSWNAASSFSTKYGHIWYAEISNPSTYTVTWTGISWPGGVAPTQATGNARSIYQFYTPDSGITIYGRQIMTSLAGA